MKVQLSFRIGIVKPVKRIIAGRTIKATDRAWREAIFGLGGSKKRIGGAKIGAVDSQPLAVIAQMPEDAGDGPAWTISTDVGVWGFIGPAAVYNDASFGPATLGISVDRLREIVTFDPDPSELSAALAQTLKSRTE
jgi:hypothetical protein